MSSFPPLVDVRSSLANSVFSSSTSRAHFCCRSGADRHTASSSSSSSAAVGTTSSVRYPHQPSASSSSATAPAPQLRRLRPTATEHRSCDERTSGSSHRSRRSGNSTAVGSRCVLPPPNFVLSTPAPNNDIVPASYRRNGDAKHESPVLTELALSSGSSGSTTAKPRQRSNSTESSASSGTSLSPRRVFLLQWSPTLIVRPTSPSRPHFSAVKQSAAAFCVAAAQTSRLPAPSQMFSLATVAVCVCVVATSSTACRPLLVSSFLSLFDHQRGMERETTAVVVCTFVGEETKDDVTGWFQRVDV